jgi:hypothetical protein
MEAAASSKMFVSTYKIKWCQNQKTSVLIFTTIKPQAPQIKVFADLVELIFGKRGNLTWNMKFTKN